MFQDLYLEIYVRRDILRKRWSYNHKQKMEKYVLRKAEAEDIELSGEGNYMQLLVDKISKTSFVEKLPEKKKWHFVYVEHQDCLLQNSETLILLVLIRK